MRTKLLTKLLLILALGLVFTSPRIPGIQSTDSGVALAAPDYDPFIKFRRAWQRLFGDIKPAPVSKNTTSPENDAGISLDEPLYNTLIDDFLEDLAKEYPLPPEPPEPPAADDPWNTDPGQPLPQQPPENIVPPVINPPPQQGQPMIQPDPNKPLPALPGWELTSCGNGIWEANEVCDIPEKDQETGCPSGYGCHACNECVKVPDEYKWYEDIPTCPRDPLTGNKRRPAYWPDKWNCFQCDKTKEDPPDVFETDCSIPQCSPDRKLINVRGTWLCVPKKCEAGKELQLIGSQPECVDQNNPPPNSDVIPPDNNPGPIFNLPPERPWISSSPSTPSPSRSASPLPSKNPKPTASSSPVSQPSKSPAASPSQSPSPTPSHSTNPTPSVTTKPTPTSTSSPLPSTTPEPTPIDTSSPSCGNGSIDSGEQCDTAITGSNNGCDGYICYECTTCEVPLETPASTPLICSDDSPCASQSSGDSCVSSDGGRPGTCLITSSPECNNQYLICEPLSLTSRLTRWLRATLFFWK